MTRMTGPDCAVMYKLINTHTHTLWPVGRRSLSFASQADAARPSRYTSISRSSQAGEKERVSLDEDGIKLNATAHLYLLFFRCKPRSKRLFRNSEKATTKKNRKKEMKKSGSF